jgi:hypothetical protein
MSNSRITTKWPPPTIADYVINRHVPETIFCFVNLTEVILVPPVGSEKGVKTNPRTTFLLQLSKAAPQSVSID